METLTARQREAKRNRLHFKPLDESELKEISTILYANCDEFLAYQAMCKLRQYAKLQEDSNLLSIERNKDIETKIDEIKEYIISARDWALDN